jgi:hypothetical protein
MKIVAIRERWSRTRTRATVEYNYAERFLAQYGVTKDELISRLGGSP